MPYSSKRTSTPDATSGHPFVTAPSASDPAVFMPAGLSLQDVVGAKPTAHRSGLTTVDTATDMSTGGAGFGNATRLTLGNGPNLLIWGEATTAAAQVTVVPIYYSADGIVLFEGTPLTLVSGPRQVQNLGNYLTAFHEVWRAPGAGSMRLYVSAISGTWALYTATF